MIFLNTYVKEKDTFLIKNIAIDKFLNQKLWVEWGGCDQQSLFQQGLQVKLEDQWLLCLNLSHSLQ